MSKEKLNLEDIGDNNSTFTVKNTEQGLQGITVIDGPKEEDRVEERNDIFSSLKGQTLTLTGGVEGLLTGSVDEIDITFTRASEEGALNFTGVGTLAGSSIEVSGVLTTAIPESKILSDEVILSGSDSDSDSNDS